MAIALTEDLRSLADVARSFVKSHDLRKETRELVTEASTELPSSWKAMADLGWAGLHLPESAGGSGAGLAELAVVVEQLGTVAAPGPLLPAVIGSAVLARIGAADDLLPRLADGSAIAAFAPAPGVRVEGGEGGTADGTCTVLGGAWADHLVLASGADVLLVAADAPGVTVTPAEGALDPALGIALVALDGAEVQTIAGAASGALATARTIAAAEASGGARGVLTMAVEYAKVREQFGRTIGSFQAIKHHLADMLVDAERATAVAWDAANAAAHADTQSELAAVAAAAIAFPAYIRNAQMNIQVHGGIGFTWEHDAHLYLRRAQTINVLLGGSDAARDELFTLTTAGHKRKYGVDLPPEAETFRTEAAQFVEKLHAAPTDQRRALLVESRYLVPHWPAPYGRAAGAVEQLVIDEEFVGVELPSLGIGGWVLLTITQQGNAEQVERWAAPSLIGELKWCQLFSEPNAGSDAAAVQTKATRVEGGWRITGQKVWTSDARACNRGLATVRTDPEASKHKGITTVAVDLQAEGVEVRPLREITGEAMFNEVFFDDVFIPDADVVGEVNEGWTVARATLGNERVSIGGGPSLGQRAADLVPLLQEHAADDAGLRREIGGVVADEQAIRLMNLRQVTRAVVGAEPGVEGNLTKLLVAVQAQHVSELAMRIAGRAIAGGGEPRWSYDYLMARALTIAGGTSEITRNVIAERVLGLPRDPLNR